MRRCPRDQRASAVALRAGQERSYRVAAHRVTTGDHGCRVRQADGERGEDRILRTRLLARKRVRLRPLGCVSTRHSGGQALRRQHGGHLLHGGGEARQAVFGGPLSDTWSVASTNSRAIALRVVCAVCAIAALLLAVL